MEGEAILATARASGKGAGGCKESTPHLVEAKTRIIDEDS
jgi:hypothetical protein